MEEQMPPSSSSVLTKRLTCALGQCLAVSGLMTLLVGTIAGRECGLFLATAVGPATPQVLYFPPGTSFKAMAQKLQESGVVSSALFLRISAHTVLRGDTFKAGEYAFASPMTPSQVLKKLRTGDVVVHSFRIIEGLESEIIFAQLQKEAALGGPLTLRDIPEGSLLPETYHFQRPETKMHLLVRMQKTRDALLTALWRDRQASLPLQTPREAVILASLVEKETPLPHERPRVAAVFLNRLKLGMPLQCDATVRYGLWQKRGEPLKGALSKADLQEDTPFNSYLHRGLPPTPICHPGRASVAAVLHPAPVDDLYFVADGKGGHVFSKTYTQHQTNHQAWRAKRAAS
ncbi:MAG: endolytic transglycosylase MltG [Candidatus Puniceispirillum sp.]|nr:endolytic transglycosylase MltG [Candidatus Puniceispirillum sp.]